MSNNSKKNHQKKASKANNQSNNSASGSQKLENKKQIMQTSAQVENKNQVAENNNSIENKNAVSSQKVLEKQANVQKNNLKTEKTENLKNKKTESKTGFNWSDPNFVNRILAIAVGLLAIGSTVAVSGYVIPNVILQQTDEAKANRERQENESKSKAAEEKRIKQLAEEDQKLKFVDQKVEMKIKDFGALKIDLKDKAAPKTVENFLRLTSRGYYNGLIFHRMVEAKDFAVIQGGDPTGTGSGGETASGQPLVDEVWSVKPEYDTTAVAESGAQSGKITNEPKFTDATLYKEFNRETGTVNYEKGLILMAKTSAPDSASSQFFITLEKTVLPAQYTVFGVIEPSSFETLEKISKEIDPKTAPEQQQFADYKDGAPNKELKIEEVKIV